MIDFTSYVRGNDIATKLIREVEDLVECLSVLGDYLDKHPDHIVEIHNTAMDNDSCPALRKLGVILSNMQGGNDGP